MRGRYNLLTKRMQAKLKMEERTTGIDVETSELDALPEDVLEKEKEVIFLNKIWCMTKKKKILDVSERCLFLNWRGEKKKEFPRRHPWAPTVV